MLKVQTKNKLDVPTVLESIKELGIMSLIVGVLYFLTGIQEVDFGIYSAIAVAVSKVLIKLIQEFKKGQ